MKKLFIFQVLSMCVFVGAFVTKNAFSITEPELYIKAINPGYTIDGAQNVGEFIEIARKTASTDEKLQPISLAGLLISYTNSSGNSNNLLEFPENSWLTGETLLLRLTSSLASEQSNYQYSKTIAMKAGPLLLANRDGVVLDTVCWTGKNECSTEFDKSHPTSLVRNLETDHFEHKTEYEPVFNPDNIFFEELVDEAESPMPQCQNARFSEILSFYEASQSEQFVEIYNPTAEQILLDGCKLGYKNQLYSLSGILKPEGYLARFAVDFALTKNPVSNNTITLIDTTGDVVDTHIFYNGQRKATSEAIVGYDHNGDAIWKTTYAPTPGEPNIYQEFKTCSEGKVINESTGNCVKVATITETICPEGKYLNPATGRCKTIEVEEEKTCADGYELNPETNRCRKIKNNDGAEYELETEQNLIETKSFIAIYALAIIITLGVAYIIFQYRQEIIKFFGKAFRLFQQKPHHDSGRH